MSLKCHYCARSQLNHVYNFVDFPLPLLSRFEGGTGYLNCKLTVKFSEVVQRIFYFSARVGAEIISLGALADNRPALSCFKLYLL